MGITSKKERTNKIKLSIQVSLDGFSFCALEKERNAIIFFKEIAFPKKLNPIEVLKEIEKQYKDSPFLQKQPEEVQVLFHSHLYNFVPQEYFVEENASDYLKFSTKIFETDFVAHDDLDDLGIVNVYIPFTNINNYFFDKYGEFEYRHVTSIFTEEFLKAEQSDQEGEKAYLHKTSSGFDLIIIKQGKLFLASSFSCETKEDFIYYLLFTIEQLRLDPEALKLNLFGKISPDSDYYKIAYRYIRHIDFLQVSFGLTFEAENEPPKAHEHFALLKSLL